MKLTCLSSCTHLIIIGLCCILGLYHSLKSYALPPSFLFENHQSFSPSLVHSFFFFYCSAWLGWHHRLKRHEFEQALGDGKGKGSLACCSPWRHKESDTTERLNSNKCRATLLGGPAQSNLQMPAVPVDID